MSGGGFWLSSLARHRVQGEMVPLVQELSKQASMAFSRDMTRLLRASSTSMMYSESSSPPGVVVVGVTSLVSVSVSVSVSVRVEVLRLLVPVLLLRHSVLGVRWSNASATTRSRHESVLYLFMLISSSTASFRQRKGSNLILAVMNSAVSYTLAGSTKKLVA